MSYRYQTKTDVEIEAIAERVLRTFPDRRIGVSVDIEGILEDLGLELLPRQGFRRHADGYLARDPRYIVIDETILSYLPRARFTIAEEVCHVVLEYRLWQGGMLPEGADGHELSEEQHFFVEKDATSLASAILMPKSVFEETYAGRRRQLAATGAPESNVVRETLKQVSEVFQVSPKAAGYRALKLKLISRSLLPT